jgi:hypothetical protein
MDNINQCLDESQVWPLWWTSFPWLSGLQKMWNNVTEVWHHQTSACQNTQSTLISLDFVDFFIRIVQLTNGTRQITWTASQFFVQHDLTQLSLRRQSYCSSSGDNVPHYISHNSIRWEVIFCTETDEDTRSKRTIQGRLSFLDIISIASRPREY